MDKKKTTNKEVKDHFIYGERVTYLYFSTLMKMRTAKLSQLILVTFLATRKTIERENIPFSQRIRPDRTPVVLHAWELD